MRLLMFLGGLGFLLFGMTVTEMGLRELCEGKLRSILARSCGTVLKGAVTGCAVTALLQSSSSVTVMLTGLVDAEIIGVGDAAGIVIGSNIGTSATAWIIAFCGKGSVSIATLYPILIIFGSLIIILVRNNKIKKLGVILSGFSLIIAGMENMSAAVAPLIDEKSFERLDDPFTCFISGLVVTGVIQSSSASVGILQALAKTGSVTADAAIPIIIGQNIGTCSTALIAAVSAGKNAKKIPLAHLLFNILGALLSGVLYFVIRIIIDLDFAVSPFDIASIHTAFNLLAAVPAVIITGKSHRVKRRL